MRKINKVVLRHILVWVTYVCYIFLIAFVESGGYTQGAFGGILNTTKAIILNHANVAIHFYFFSYIVLPLFFRKEKHEFYLFLSISMSSFYLLRYTINFTIFPLIGITKRYVDQIDEFYLDTIWNYVLWSGYALGFFYARKSIEQEKELRILQVAKAEAEMKFLKAQINPHFMFNTLNLINSKVMKASKSASAIVIQLSDMFRYMTGKEGQKDLVNLKDEVEFVFNYVDMLNKRNNYGMAVAVDQEGDFTKYQITPMVLVTILENAFKHGEVFEHDFPLIVTMKMDSEKLFTFSTQNKIKVEEQKGTDTGIGISNITQRLQAVHGNTFTLKSYLNDTQEYVCELTIQY